MNANGTGMQEPRNCISRISDPRPPDVSGIARNLPQRRPATGWIRRANYV